MAQGKLVELGEVLSRIISLQMTLNLGQKGFNQKLINSTVETLKSDVRRMVGTFKDTNDAEVIENYQESSAWIDIFSTVPA
jgi:hypothetical protein